MGFVGFEGEDALFAAGDAVGHAEGGGVEGGGWEGGGGWLWWGG